MDMQLDKKAKLVIISKTQIGIWFTKKHKELFQYKVQNKNLQLIN